MLYHSEDLHECHGLLGASNMEANEGQVDFDKCHISLLAIPRWKIE